MSIYRDIERLIQYGIKKNLIEDEDKIFIRNSLLSLFNLDEFEEVTIEDENLDTPTPILNNLLDYAYKNGILESNTPIYRDLFDTKIMGILMPRPSDVIKEFKI